MRKIILQNMISADGYFEGPLRDISWHRVDAEYNQYAIEFLNEVDTLIFGRYTYDLMKDYWSRPEVIEEDPAVANRINSINKLVFSGTLKTAGWSHSKLVTRVSSEAMGQLKKEEGKHMAMFGSSNLALSFIHEQLIDEIRLIINPVIRRIFDTRIASPALPKKKRISVIGRWPVYIKL